MTRLRTALLATALVALAAPALADAPGSRLEQLAAYDTPTVQQFAQVPTMESWVSCSAEPAAAGAAMASFAAYALQDTGSALSLAQAFAPVPGLLAMGEAFRPHCKVTRTKYVMDAGGGVLTWLFQAARAATGCELLEGTTTGDCR